MLGDPQDYYDDYHYTGEDGSSAWTLQYYRNKISEFQGALVGFDQAYNACKNLLTSGAIEGTWLQIECDAFMILYDQKRLELRTLVETINAASAVVNAVGGRMPVLSAPSGLGNPLALGALAGAIAAAIWAIDWIRGAVSEIMMKVNEYDTLAQIPEEQRAQVAVARTQLAEAKAKAESPLSSVSKIIMWSAIGVAAFFAFQLLSNRK